MTSEGSFLFENLKQIGVECSFCNLLSCVAFWNLGIYLEGTGHFGERSDFEKSKYYNDETLENTCRKNFKKKKLFFLAKKLEALWRGMDINIQQTTVLLDFLHGTISET